MRRPGALSTAARLTMLGETVTALRLTPASLLSGERIPRVLVSVAAEVFPECDAVWATMRDDEYTSILDAEGHRLAASLSFDSGTRETNGGPRRATLVLYRTRYEFDTVDDVLLRVLITTVSAAIDAARYRWQTENLHHAIASRAEIEQAKGMIMAMRGSSADDAFQMLVEQSQLTNTKLALIARDIVDIVARDGEASRRHDQASTNG